MRTGTRDHTIMIIAGHVSRNMLRHYSHMRIEAKRKAVQTIVDRRKEAQPEEGKIIDAQLKAWMP